MGTHCMVASGFVLKRFLHIINYGVTVHIVHGDLLIFVAHVVLQCREVVHQPPRVAVRVMSSVRHIGLGLTVGYEYAYMGVI